MNQLLVLFLVALYIFFLPFTVIAYVLAPNSKVKINLKLISVSLENLFNNFISKIGKFLIQPCVKFISHTITYMIFIILIIVSSVKFSEEQKESVKFSKLMPENLYNNYTSYVSLPIDYKFEFVDFWVRNHVPSELDIAITIWIIGLYIFIYNFYP